MGVFYGQMRGNFQEVSRGGSYVSGMYAILQTGKFGVKVSIKYEDRGFVVYVDRKVKHNVFRPLLKFTNNSESKILIPSQNIELAELLETPTLTTTAIPEERVEYVFEVARNLIPDELVDEPPNE